ncbi:histidine phosphatase superfamily [Suillus bovinus]|uniref:histidine phosphatase superfamily n=1 Tax=Suillus bovinus TaxID=48563 RepID=UPI001B8716E8|nr:histidine phosphatase superfamily [Suillus bovinus]KAG2142802.1 histidine phosphatase superfamily [Suillus bovinus]
MVKKAEYPLVLPLSSSGKPAAYDDSGLEYHSSGSSLIRKAISISLALLITVLLFRRDYFKLIPRLVSGGLDSPSILFTESQRFWGPYSPYYAVEEYNLPPDGCSITQASITLQRHGARYPTSGASKTIKASLQKLLNASEYTDMNLDFLRSYQWRLGKADLVPFGATQSFQSGAEIYHRYEHLVNDHMLPFVRASGGDRVVKSAVNWTEGFADASGQLYHPSVSVIIPETETSNNTLQDHMCPNSQASHDEANMWRDVFSASIVQRLNTAAVGAEILSEDIPGLMSLCAFETVFEEKESQFCDLFSLKEFRAYDYYQDLLKYYDTGYGNPLGRVQGVGYVNELLARLRGRPVEDRTQTNSTLDSSPITFPLDKTVYVDFSHDNEMVAIYGALGLFPQMHPPNPTKVGPQWNWVVSRLVPFSGRMITEKVQCFEAGVPRDFIRILVNDAIQPLAFCGTGDGLCELEAFVESQSYARNNGAW